MGRRRNKVTRGLEDAVRHAKGEGGARVTDYVVTGDKAMKAGGLVLTDADREILSGSNAVAITPQQLMQLARVAAATYAEFSGKIAPAMTPERAARIRQWRCVDSYSWRAVAQAAHEAWGETATWTPPSNQLAGMALCEQAAWLLGEDPKKEPWN